MRNLLISVAAATALVGAAAIGHAQTQDDKGEGSAAERKGPALTQPGKAHAEPKVQPRTGVGVNSGRKRPTAAPSRTTDRPKSSDGQQKATDRPERTEGPQRDKDQQKSAQGKGRDMTKSAKQPRQDERIRVTQQQRSTVRERLAKTRIEKTRIKMAAKVGAAIPRSVRLRSLPVAILEVAPEYADTATLCSRTKPSASSMREATSSST